MSWAAWRRAASCAALQRAARARSSSLHWLEDVPRQAKAMDTRCLVVQQAWKPEGEH